MTYQIKENAQFGSREIYFTEKPAEEVREALKALRFRWNGKKSCWYGFADEEKITAAIGSGSGSVILPTAQDVEPGTLYAGWTGGNSHKWRDYDELKKCLMADFKQAGIKASIKKRRAGYLTAIDCTLTISAADILPEDAFIADSDFNICSRAWLYYTDELGDLRYMHINDYCALSADGQNAMLDNLKRTEYRTRLDRIVKGYEISKADVELLTEPARRKFEILQAIVESYNHDQSNGMIDYFDRDIYDDYYLKIA